MTVVPANEPPVGGDAVAGRIQVLARLLRGHGVDVSLSELLDAHHAVAAIDLGSRSLLRTVLRATLVKHAAQLDVFDACFDRAFPHRASVSSAANPSSEGDAAARLATGDELAVLAADLVDQHGGMDGELRGEKHHIQRVYRGADLAKMMSDARKADPSVTPDQLRRQIDELKKLIAADIRSQLGPPDVDAVDGELQDLDFLNASRAELDQLRSTVRPLARRLATRLARRRRLRRDGRVNMRRTLRRSLSNGGVPLHVASERPKAHRPELFVLCDISGSMADVSLFTLTLVSALSSELARTRSFVFVDAIDEITALLARTEHGIEPGQILRNTDVIGETGHSDYGTVLRQFWDEVGERELRPTSTVVITGDARNNHHPTQAAVLADIARRCRRIYWFNPEPIADWGTEDSEMRAYGDHCSDVFEVRNLRQLVDCVEQIL